MAVAAAVRCSVVSWAGLGVAVEESWFPELYCWEPCSEQSYPGSSAVSGLFQESGLSALFEESNYSGSSPVWDSLASFQALGSTAQLFQALALQFPVWVRPCPEWAQLYPTGVESLVVTCWASVMVQAPSFAPQLLARTLPSG